MEILERLAVDAEAVVVVEVDGIGVAVWRRWSGFGGSGAGGVGLTGCLVLLGVEERRVWLVVDGAGLWWGPSLRSG
jgi:hypothetical protein